MTVHVGEHHPTRDHDVQGELTDIERGATVSAEELLVSGETYRGVDLLESNEWTYWNSRRRSVWDVFKTAS